VYLKSVLTDHSSNSVGHLTYPHGRPVLFLEHDQAIFNFFRFAFTGYQDAPRPSHLPAVSAAQREALDLVESLAHQHHVAVDMQPGDLTFLNNFGLLHSREAFRDDKHHTRHLVRLWLKNSTLAKPLPPALEFANSRIFDDNGELPEKWDLVPCPRIRFKLCDRLAP